MKYIIDLDALKNCLTFLDSFEINGHEAVYLNNVKLFIDNFPKDAVEENAADTEE